MTNAWFLGAQTSIPQSEDEVRNTTEPIRADSPAEDRAAPNWNEFRTDETGQVTGPTAARMLASDTKDSVQYEPWWTQLAQQNHNELIDNQVSSSGTAAAREAAGIQGHGTAQYAIGIEPVIREGAAFGSDYFTAYEAGANPLAGAYMTPVDIDNSGRAAVASHAQQNAREAYAGLYDAFLNASK